MTVPNFKTLISDQNLGLQNLNHSVYGSCLSKEVHDHQVEHQVAQNEVSKGPFWGKILQEMFGKQGYAIFLKVK